MAECRHSGGGQIDREALLSKICAQLDLLLVICVLAKAFSEVREVSSCHDFQEEILQYAGDSRI